MAYTKVKPLMVASFPSSRLTGAFGAISGANLTGLGDGIDTKSASSDPAINTNPAAVGHTWLNKTSGEMFVCTTATTDANVWVNVGDYLHGVGKPFGGVGGGTQFGYCAGGASPNSRIDKFALGGSGVTATTIGNLTNGAIYMGGGHSSTTHGYVSGGSPNGGTTGNFSVDEFSFAAGATRTMSGVTLNGAGNGKQNCSGHSSLTHGYTAGGYGTNSPQGIGIDKWAYSSSSAAADWGDLLTTKYNAAAHTSSTDAYASGGHLGFGLSNTTGVETFSLANSNSTTTHSNLTSAPNSRRVGSNNSTHGYTSGGGSTNVIDKYAFASNANATDHGNLSTNREANSGCSSTTSGYYLGGAHGSVPFGKTIDKFLFASTTTATDHGDLTTQNFNHGSSGCQQ